MSIKNKVYDAFAYRFSWKRQLQRKQEDAEVTNASITVLIKNILPSHVGKYL